MRNKTKLYRELKNVKNKKRINKKTNDLNKKKKTINEIKTLTKQQQQRINKDKKQKFRKRRNN